jgi:hypothetical protein
MMETYVSTAHGEKEQKTTTKATRRNRALDLSDANGEARGGRAGQQHHGVQAVAYVVRH